MNNNSTKTISFIIPWHGKDDSFQKRMENFLVENIDDYKENIKILISVHNDNYDAICKKFEKFENVKVASSKFTCRVQLISESLKNVKTDLFSILDLDDFLNFEKVNFFLEEVSSLETDYDSYRNHFYHLVDFDRYVKSDEYRNNLKSIRYYKNVHYFITANSIFSSKLINERAIEEMKKVNFMSFDDLIFSYILSVANKRKLSFTPIKQPFYYHMQYGKQNHSNHENQSSISNLKDVKSALGILNGNLVHGKLSNDKKYVKKLILMTLKEIIVGNKLSYSDLSIKLNRADRKTLFENNVQRPVSVEEINIIAFTDENTIESAIAMINTIKKIYKNNEVIVNLGVTKGCKKYYRFLLNENIKVRYIDDFLPDANKTLYQHITKTAYARLYFDKIFPYLKTAKKILYVDVDVFFRNRIDERIFNSNENIAFNDLPDEKHIAIHKGWLKGILSNFDDIYSKNSKILENGNYFNSGVIVINNFDKILNLFSKVLNFLSDVSEVDDQNLLNYFNDGEIIVSSDTRYNFQPFKEKFKKNAFLIHYAGAQKPWKKSFEEKFKNHIEYNIVLNDFEKINPRIKMLILEEKSESIVSVKNLIFDDNEIGLFANVYTSEDVSFEELKPIKYRNRIVDESSTFNTKLLNEFDLIINQSYFVHINPKFRKSRNDQVIIEFFHGTIVKDPSNLNPWDNKVDYFLSPNKWSTQVLLDLGWNEQRILKFGYPRVDYYKFISENASQDKNTAYQLKIADTLPEMAKNKKLVLFAPSWINTKKDGKTFELDYSLNSILEKIGEDEILIVSPHLNQSMLKNINYTFDDEYKNKLLINGVDFERMGTYALLWGCVKMITDFSSVIFDYGDVMGFDKIEIYNPIIDQIQDELTRKFYNSAYHLYGTFNSKVNYWDLPKEEFADWFSFYKDEEFNASQRMLSFIKDKARSMSSSKKQKDLE